MAKKPGKKPGIIKKIAGAATKAVGNQKDFRRIVNTCNERMDLGEDSAGKGYKSCEDYARTVIWPDKYPPKKKKKSLKDQGITGPLGKPEDYKKNKK